MASIKVKSNSFPDVRIPKVAGQFSGLVAGLQGYTQQREYNRQSAISDALIGIKTADVMRKSTDKLSIKDVFSAYNKDKEIAIKALGDFADPMEIDRIRNESFTAWLSRNPEIASISNLGALRSKVAAGNLSAPVGDNLTNNVGMVDQSMADVRAGNYVKAPVGQGLMGGMGQRIKQGIMNMGSGVKNVLDMLMQKVPKANPIPMPDMQGGEGLTTDALLQAMEDYDESDVDTAIEDLMALDSAANQPGLQLPENIDYELLKQAFVQKFGQNALAKLERRVNGLS